MQYEQMHQWFCSQEVNKAKKVCTAAKPSKTMKGPHPLFVKTHAHHQDWNAMATGWCELEGNKEKFVCKMVVSSLRAASMAEASMAKMKGKKTAVAKAPSSA